MSPLTTLKLARAFKVPETRTDTRPHAKCVIHQMTLKLRAK